MDGGNMPVGVSVLTGSPFWKHTHDEEMTDDKLWDILSKHDLDTDIMTAGTSCKDKSITNDQDCNTPQGLAANHAYTVLGVASITKKGEEVRLVKVRNPWGENQYKGPWNN